MNVRHRQLSRNRRRLDPPPLLARVAILVAAALLPLACAPPPVQTVLPTEQGSEQPTGTAGPPGGASPTATSPNGAPPHGTSSNGTSPSAPACADEDPTASYDPLPELPAPEQIVDPGLREILQRGHLVVGISDDTLGSGARDPGTGELQGFDIDLARYIARSLFGSDQAVRWRVIRADERENLLRSGDIDLVARNMTITCDRWERIAFSVEYYRASQKLMVRWTPGQPDPDTSLADMAGKKVCAPAGTSTLRRLQNSFPDVVAVPAETHTDCLVRFQNWEVDAITGDDVVLAGLAAQDTYAKVTTAPPPPGGSEPYGLGFKYENTYLVSYVNRVLAQYEADPDGWRASYDRWYAPALGPAQPPRPRYGRVYVPLAPGDADD